VAISREKLNTPPPPVLEVYLHFTQSAFFLLVLFPILVYLAGEKTQKMLNLPNSWRNFALLPKLERPDFIPDRVTRGSLKGDQSPLLPPKGRPIV
jgi:hypothetical protein